ncbi:DDE-type integrase/transposase/recombinase [Rhizophagus irregularis DAOM 181602=DAOM 197198]|nr:DDE-type integrase/transposase/recombinase [Rhizophagus irregularis DAOM 181602=DAOM 197198]
MDLSTYFSLIQFLTDYSMPIHLTKEQRAAIKRKSRYFIILNDQLYKKNKDNPSRPIKVVKESEVESILYHLHSDPLSGHFSIDETYRRVKIRYYWPQMFTDVRHYVRTCDECQRRGKNRRVEPLHPIKVGQPFDRLGMDIVGPLPKTKRGNTHIVVATEYLTKWPEARAIPNAKASSVVSFFYEDIICRHGCPKVLLTDRGTHFVNEMLDSLCIELGVKHKLSTAYHPQTNGLVERFNRTLCEALAKYANENKDDWDIYLTSVLFAYRTKRHNTTRHEPFYLMYGREAILPIEFANRTPQVELSESDFQQDLFNRIHTLTGKVIGDRLATQDVIHQSQQKQKQRHDKNLCDVQFKIGDLVLLFRSQLRGKQKLQERWKGPYYVHESLDNGAFKLRTMDGKVLKDPVNSDRLKSYCQRRTVTP